MESVPEHAVPVRRHPRQRRTGGRATEGQVSRVVGEGALYLLDPVRLDDIIDLDVIVAGNLHTALEALADLAGIFLEALQRFQTGGTIGRRINDHTIADDADLGRPLDDALGDI